MVTKKEKKKSRSSQPLTSTLTDQMLFGIGSETEYNRIISISLPKSHYFDRKNSGRTSSFTKRESHAKLHSAIFWVIFVKGQLVSTNLKPRLFSSPVCQEFIPAGSVTQKIKLVWPKLEIEKNYKESQSLNGMLLLYLQM